MVNEFEGVWILATFGFVQQKIECIWQKALIMEMVAINKISRNMKIMRFKMPNAPYSTRCSQ